MIERTMLISVIIPVFNREQTIEKCIKSVLNQTYTNLEVIVVNDCSTDGTQKIISQIQDARVKLVSLEKNSGAQIARNRGIQEANGEWIAFLDSDDWFEVDKTSMQVALLEKNDFNEYMVIHSNCYCYDTTSNKKWLWKLPFTNGNCYKTLLKRPSTTFSSILVSKKALIDIEYLDINLVAYQEWDTSIRLATICKFIHIDKPLFTYVFHEGDAISKHIKKDIDGYFYIIQKNRSELIKYGLYNRHIVNLIIKITRNGLWDSYKILYSELLNNCSFGRVLFFILKNKFIPLRLKLYILKIVKYF